MAAGKRKILTGDAAAIVILGVSIDSPCISNL
jgi:hypothetical protein